MFLSFNNSVPACYVSDVVLVQSAILDNVRDQKGLSLLDIFGLFQQNSSFLQRVSFSEVLD